MKRIFHLLIFLFVLNSCDSEFKPVTFETTEVDSSFKTEISVIFDKAKGNDELSKTINFKIEEAIINSLSSVGKKTNLYAVLKDFDNEYLAFKKEFPESEEPIWELHIETEKTYQSEDIITIAISTYEFKGGAHGNDKIAFLNLDAKSGKILNQSDIIANIKDFKSLAKDYFVKSLEEDNESLKMEDIFLGKPFQLPEHIGFTEDGIILLYSPYEIASYNQGYTEFVIPFEDAEPYLNFI